MKNRAQVGKKIAGFVLFLLLLTGLSSNVYADCRVDGCPNTQTCSCESVQCVNPVPGDPNPCTGNGQSCSCGRAGGSCNKPGIPVDCPAGTVRSNVVASSVCMGFCSLGTAQAPSGVCCDWQYEPPSGCVTTCVHNYITGNDRCRTDCANNGGDWCRTGVTNTYVCDPICSAGTAPTSVSPAAGAEAPIPVNFSWNAGTWGYETATGNRTYTVCAGQNSTNPCTGGQTFDVTGAEPTTSYVATNITPGDQYWAVKGTNACGTSTALSEVRSVCVEGFSVTDTAYVSNWTACDANHKHTRTCREDCGTNNCAATALIEDCQGEVSGTIFNASDYGSCPAFDPATGYLVGLPAGTGAPSRTFGFTDQSSTAPHPWSPLTPATTDADGNYKIRAYAPAIYNYDFSSLSDIYVTGGGPKLTCFSSAAAIPSNPVTCQTQPCSLVYGMSFGFWKMYSGWWQVVGGSVHGDKGIYSDIPSSLLTEMSLILPDTTAGNRVGFLSYGVPRPTNMLGTNPLAKVSTNLWEAQSKYGGQIYDWGFFDKRFNLFAKTVWSDGQTISYGDGGLGYQIFKSDSSINTFDFSPTGTEKAMFIVNGDVKVTSDIVVPEGAFLAIIAKGTITFDPTVSRADGWYVANTISVPCQDIDSNGCDKTDIQFLGNGSFVGWNSISMTRNRGSVNNTAPSEKFTYRQDLFLNAPKPMKIYTKQYTPFVP